MLATVTATVVLGAGVLTRPLPLGGVAWMLFLVPGVLLGIALIWLLNRPPLAAFYRGAGVLVLAYGLRYLALEITVLKPRWIASSKAAFWPG